MTLTDWSNEVTVTCTYIEVITDWSNEVQVTCTYNICVTDWSDELRVTCTYREEVTNWSNTITVICRKYANTKEDYEELFGKHLGSREWEKDHYIETAKNLAILKNM